MQEAVEQFPQDPAAINNASAVALQEGRLGEAKALLDRTPESASRQNNLGVYYMLTGDWARAQAAFTKALNGGISDARHNLDIVARQLSLKKQREREETERKAIPYRIR
jgi:Flp pilus assembly protein TadD